MTFSPCGLETLAKKKRYLLYGKTTLLIRKFHVKKAVGTTFFFSLLYFLASLLGSACGGYHPFKPFF